MDTPREWTNRFGKARGEACPSDPKAEVVEGANAAVEFPSEPFQCPACGQLLAPSCRVCVSCRQSIDPAAIALRAEAPAIALPAPIENPELSPVRFPWQVFFAVLGASFVLALLFLQLWGEQKARWALWGLQSLASIWVFVDALRSRVPQPLRWGLGSLLLPVIVFPWYLARRRLPQSPCPFVEGKMGPVTRFILVALIIFFALNAVSYFVMGPSHK